MSLYLYVRLDIYTFLNRDLGVMLTFSGGRVANTSQTGSLLLWKFSNLLIFTEKEVIILMIQCDSIFSSAC